MILPDELYPEEDREMQYRLEVYYGGYWQLRDARFPGRCCRCGREIEQGDVFFWGGPKRAHHRYDKECES